MEIGCIDRLHIEALLGLQQASLARLTLRGRSNELGALF